MATNMFQQFLRKAIIKLFPQIVNLENETLDFRMLESGAPNSKIDETVKLYKPFHIDNSVIKKYTYVSHNSYISLTEIGSFCSVGPNLVCGYGIHPLHGISSHPMFYSIEKQNGITLSQTNKIEERKKIKIGNDVMIGANVTILDGVEIGDGAVIGAGAVVSKNIPPYAVAVGAPVQILKYRQSQEVIKKLLKISWWNWDADKLPEVEKYFDDVDAFVKKYS